MKKAKDNKNLTNVPNYIKKQGRSIKEVVPSNNTKHLRENIPVNPTNIPKENNRDYSPFAEPFAIPQEFPSNIEEINKELLNMSHPYEDPSHEDLAENLPLSFMKALITLGAEIKWIRIEECVRNYIIDREIKISYPKKNYVKMRNDIKEKYEVNKKMYAEYPEGMMNTEDDVETLLADDEESRKKNIYKEFYKLLDKKLELRVVNYIERIESDEDFKKRKEEEYLEKIRIEALQKSQKKGGRPVPDTSKKAVTKGSTNTNVVIPMDGERLKYKESSPSNISIIEMIRNAKTNYTSLTQIPAFFMLNSYCKWVSSVLQLVKDLEINDAYTNKPVWYNIYPQNDGIPVYNPYGKYIVKLYFMGKPRYIEIDDRIPCNRYEDYLFPKTEYIEEIWPALFTKALMKLHIYKMKHPKYFMNEEVGDCSVIYALTGYIGETIDLPQSQSSKDNLSLIKLIEKISSDEFYLDKKKYLICLNKREIDYSYTPDSNVETIGPYENIKEDFRANNKKNMTIGFLGSFPGAKGEGGKALVNFENQIRSAERKYTKRNSVKVIKNDMIMNLAKVLNLQGLNTLSTEDLLNKKEENPKSVQRKFSQMFRGSSQTSTNLIRLNSIKNKMGNRSSDPMNDKNIPFTSPGSPGEEVQLPLFDHSNIYYDFAYSITDFFDNNNFNMNRLKPLDFSDLKQKIKEAHSTAYKTLSKEEKKAYLANLIDLKNKQKEEKLRRMEELKKEGKKFNLVKIKNQVCGSPVLNFYIDYSEEEIFMAKKCLLNRWDFPPPSYFEQIFAKEQGDKQTEGVIVLKQSSEVYHHSPGTRRLQSNNMLMNSSKDSLGVSEDLSMELARNKRNLQSNNWNKDIYMQLINENLSQYFIMRDPIMREADGVWLNYNDFKKHFNRLIILHNPCKVYLGSKVSADNNWNYYQTDYFEPIDDLTVFYLGVGNFSHQNQNTNSNNDPNLTQSIFINEHSSLLILFKPNSDKTLPSSDKLNYYITLDLVDNTGVTVKENIILTSFFSTFFHPDLETDKEYFVLIKGGVFPFGYYLQVLTESHSIENMSHNTYLKRFGQYLSNSYKIDHPVIEKNKFYLLARGVLRCSGDMKYVNLKVTLKYPDKYAKRFMEIFVYQNKKGDKKRINLNEMIKLDCYGYDEGGKYVINNYYFTVSVQPGFTMGETLGVADLEILYNDGKVEFIDHIEPYEISEKFVPNKHAIVFKEIIYSPDLVHASLNIRLKKDVSSTPRSNTGPTSEPINHSKNLHLLANLQKSSVNSNKNLITVGSVSTDESELEEKTRLVIELYKLGSFQPGEIPTNKTLMYRWEFYNSISIHHLMLEGVPCAPEKPALDNKKLKPGAILPETQNQVNIPYLLVCSLDMSEMPEYLRKMYSGNMSSGNLSWVIRIFSSDTLGFVKDTTKEDSERLLKESWEQNEPGRADKAKKSRLKYVLKSRKEKGEKLTEEEEKILNEERERKITINAEPVVNQQASKKLGNLANLGNIAPGKTGKKLEPLQSSSHIKKPSQMLLPKVAEQKKLPQPDDHTSEFVKDYLSYTYQERTIVFNHELDQFDKIIINEEIKDQKRREIIKKLEEFENKRQSDLQESIIFTRKPDLNETLKTFYKASVSFRKEVKEDKENLIKAREHIRNDMQMRLEIEKNITEFIKVCSNNPIDNNQLIQGMNMYKDAKKVFNTTDGEVKLLDELFTVISNKKEESLKNDLKKWTQKDKNVITKQLEEIESNNWKITEETIRRMKELSK